MAPFSELDTTADQLAEAVRASAGGVGVRVEPDPDPLPAVGPAVPAALDGVVIVVALGDGDPTPWEFHDRHHAAIRRACGRLLPHWVTWRLLFDRGDGTPVPLARPGHCRAVGSLVRPPHHQPGAEMEARVPMPNLADELFDFFRAHAERRLGVHPNHPGWEKLREEFFEAMARMPYHPDEVLGDDLRRIAVKLDARAALERPPQSTVVPRGYT